MADEGRRLYGEGGGLRGERDAGGDGGVYLSGHAPPTDWQLWKAAELTTPVTRLGYWSGAAFRGLRDRDRMPTTVVRPGSGGPLLIPRQPDRIGALRVFRSTAFLDEDTEVVDGIRSGTAARIVLDLIPSLSDKRARRLVRDALRLKVAKPMELRAMAAKHHGRRGVVRLREYCDLYAHLPFGRARSDAEVVAAELIAAAGFPMPAVNVVIAGEEADLVYFEERRIIELDGPQYHQFAAEEARKQKCWEDAGWAVDRLPTDDVYDRPHLLLALVPRRPQPKLR